MNGPATVTVVVNGEPRLLAAGVTVATFVANLAGEAYGVAVALNDQVVPRGTWPWTPLRDRDRVEVLTAVPGG